MEYYLMREDEVITLCDFAKDGRLVAYSRNYRRPELMPLSFRTSEDPLRRWWEDRQVPLSQGRVKEMLEEKGFTVSGSFLLQNLGLSLTDHYWIRPVDSTLKWKDVNLFDNDFREDLLHRVNERTGTSYGTYSPNSSLKGELEKSWAIRGGKRVLIKGNHGSSSQESINEVIAAELHKAQGYDNYTKYRLVKIKDRPYDYGCLSEL